MEPNDGAKTAWDYIAALVRILPVMGVGGLVAVVTQSRVIVMQRTWTRRLLMCLSVLSVGCVSGGVAVLGLSLFFPYPTIEVDLVAAAVAGSTGQKIFDDYSHKLFGFCTRERFKS